MQFFLLNIIYALCKKTTPKRAQPPAKAISGASLATFLHFFRPNKSCNKRVITILSIVDKSGRVSKAFRQRKFLVAFAESFAIFKSMTIDNFLNEAKTVAIFGHVRPDGDRQGLR